MAEVFPKDILLRVGGRTMARHGVLAVAGSRRGLVEVPITFTRADAATCATYVDRDAIVRLAAANVPRVEWVDLDGDGVRETPGILLEGSRIQGWQFTEDLTNAIWVKVGCTISANADGTADGIVANAGSVNANVSQPTGALTDTTQQSTFFEVKAGNKTFARITTTDKSNTSRSSWVNLSTGVVGTKNASHTVVVVKVGTYYRVHVMWPSATGATAPSAFICPAEADNNFNTTGDGATISIYERNAQHETDKAFPSSYIPRTGAGAVTRAADLLTVPFNFGPMDLTVLARVARPVHADAAGTLPNNPSVFRMGSGSVPHIRGGMLAATRQWYSYIDTATTDAQPANQNILAGSSISCLWQFKDFATAPKAANDGGSGLSAFSSAASAFSAFTDQTLEVGRIAVNEELYGVLLDLMVLRGLFTYAEAIAVP